MDKVYISVLNIDGYSFAIRGSERAVVGISREESEICGEENSVTRMAVQQLREYFSGKRTKFDYPVELTGTPFQKEVWNALMQLPYGTFVSYGDIAAKIGRPKAVRAVGQAIGKNPCLIAVPCHRVIGRDGSLTGFSAGLDLKRYLIGVERD